MIGFETIGNATLTVFDGNPVLTTDPWLDGKPYFGSWKHAYDIPKQQRENILNSKYVKDLTPIDQKKDFFPSFGEFDVPIYSLPITFNGIEVPFNFGVLPDQLEAAMLSANTKAIVGADIFQYFTLTFHYRTDKIFVENLITR